MKITVWKADHAGTGSKFYQVIHFVHGGRSFALYHWGSKSIFTKTGQVASGQAELTEVMPGEGAGSAKIKQKKKDGYVGNTEVSDLLDSDSPAEVRVWLKNNIGNDTLRTQARKLMSVLFESAPTAEADAPVKESEVPYPPEPKHQDWGSW